MSHLIEDAIEVCDICGDEIFSDQDYFIVKCFVKGEWTMDDSVYCAKCYNENEKKIEYAKTVISDLYGKLGTHEVDQKLIEWKLKKLLEFLEQ